MAAIRGLVERSLHLPSAMKHPKIPRKKRRAMAAVANGRQSLAQIAGRASVSRGTLARWIQDPELRAYMRAQNDLDDESLRARTRYLMFRALKALDWILDSPNTPWRAKAWAITTVIELNRYLDDRGSIVGAPASTARRNVVELNAPRSRQGRMARRLAQRDTPPVQSLPG
jgi:hypothetical protein